MECVEKSRAFNMAWSRVVMKAERTGPSFKCSLGPSVVRSSHIRLNRWSALVCTDKRHGFC